MGLIEHLGEFKCLKKIAIDGNIDHLESLDQLINNCQTLETLTFDNFKANEPEPEVEVGTWAKTKGIDKIKTLRSLNLLEAKNCGLWPECLEYAMLKFERIEMVSIDMCHLKDELRHSEDTEEEIKNHHFKVLEALQNIPVYEFKFHYFVDRFGDDDKHFSDIIIEHVKTLEGVVIFDKCYEMDDEEEEDNAAPQYGWIKVENPKKK